MAALTSYWIGNWTPISIGFMGPGHENREWGSLENDDQHIVRKRNQIEVVPRPDGKNNTTDSVKRYYGTGVAMSRSDRAPWP